jgi:hypothetical protein
MPYQALISMTTSAPPPKLAAVIAREDASGGSSDLLRCIKKGVGDPSLEFL